MVTIYFPLVRLLSTHLSISIQAIILTVTVYTIFQAKIQRRCRPEERGQVKSFPIEVARYNPMLLLEVASLVSYGWAVHSHIHASLRCIMQLFICGIWTLLSHVASTLLIGIFSDMSNTAYTSGQMMR